MVQNPRRPLSDHKIENGLHSIIQVQHVFRDSSSIVPLRLPSSWSNLQMICTAMLKYTLQSADQKHLSGSLHTFSSARMTIFGGLNDPELVHTVCRRHRAWLQAVFALFLCMFFLPCFQWSKRMKNEINMSSAPYYFFLSNEIEQA